MSVRCFLACDPLLFALLILRGTRHMHPCLCVQAEREKRLEPLRAAAQVQMEEAERATFKQIKELEFRVRIPLSHALAPFSPPSRTQSHPCYRTHAHAIWRLQWQHSMHFVCSLGA